MAVDALGAGGVGVEVEVDALAFEDLAGGVGNVAVLAAQNLLASVDDGHAAAEPAHRLGVLDADITAAKDDEVLRQRVEVQDALLVQIRQVAQAGDVGHDADGAGVDVDAVGLHHLAANADVMRVLEDGVVAQNLDVAALEALLVALAHAAGDGAGAFQHLLEVDRHFAGVDAVVGAAARLVRHLRAGDDRLARRAAVVDARAADLLGLGQRHLLAAVGQQARQR